METYTNSCYSASCQFAPSFNMTGKCNVNGRLAGQGFVIASFTTSFASEAVSAGPSSRRSPLSCCPHQPSTLWQLLRDRAFPSASRKGRSIADLWPALAVRGRPYPVDPQHCGNCCGIENHPQLAAKADLWLTPLIKSRAGSLLSTL